MAFALVSVDVASQAAGSTAAPPSAAPTTHRLSAAALQVQSTPHHVGHPVSFTSTGSTIDPRFHLAPSVLSFGVKTSVRVSSLSAGKSHRYQRKGDYTVTFRL